MVSKYYHRLEKSAVCLIQLSVLDDMQIVINYQQF
jgi:hypothetical protein